MRHLAFSGLLLAAPLVGFAQNKPYWAYDFGGAADDRATAVAHGPNGTVYVCGTFSGMMTYPGGSVAAQGVTDMFLARLDTAGTVEWLVTGGGPGPDRATDLAVDANGNAAVAGQFSGSVLFDGTTLNSNGPSQDIFLARYNAAGALLWARAAGSPQNVDIAEELATDGSGNIYMAGEFSHAASFGALQVTSTYDPTLQGPGTDVFLVKYSSAGDALWVKTGAASHAELATGLATDENGNCWLAGQFSDTITFDQAHPNALNNVGFLVGFNASGTEQWFRRIAGGGEVALGDLDFSGDTLWLAGGQSGNNLLFAAPPVPIASSYPYSAFALAFSPAGALRSQRTIGSNSSIMATSVDALAGEVLIGGAYACVPSELSEHYGGDGLMLSWGASNAWVCTLRSTDLSIAYAQAVVDNAPMSLRGLALSENRRVYAVGEFNDVLYCPSRENEVHVVGGDSTLTIGPNGLQYACEDTTYYDVVTLISKGQRDGFVLKCFMPDRRPMDALQRSDQNCVFDLDPGFQVLAMPGALCDPISADVAYCGEGSLAAIFDYQFGPSATYAWNNGWTQSGLSVSSPGSYSVVASVDGCFSRSGGLTVEMCLPPLSPGITDSQGVNYQDTVTASVNVCLPTLIDLTAGPLPADTFYWVGPGPTYFPDTTVTASTPGLWVLVAQNGAGCTMTTPINISYTPNEELGNVLVQPAIGFSADTDHNDTIVICSQDAINAYITGTFIRNGIAMPANGPFNVLDTVNVYPIGIVDQGAYQIADSGKAIATPFAGNGWYVFDVLLHIDDSPCRTSFASGTVRDSIYVIGIPGQQSQVDILGSIFLCSGDTVHLTTLASAPGTFHWLALNGGIVGPDTLPSIDLVEAGLVSVAFMPSDTSACTYGASDAHSVDLVPAPSVVMDPLDGLICPGGSVDIQVGNVTGTYAWYGPGGLLPFNTPTITVQDPGVYFCVVSTVQGCAYATALQTVSLYSTPSLVVFPEPVLCAGGSVEVVVQPTQNADYVWLPPLSGSTPYQTITQPGTYGCQVTQCGVTTSLSFTVTQSTVDVSIADPGPFVICPGDSALLSAVAGNTAYVWQPGGLVGQQVFTSTEGDYSVIAFNDHGCSDTAGVVAVDIFGFTTLITAQGDAVCPGFEGTGTALGSGAILWYEDQELSQLADTGASITVQHLVATDTLYVVQEEGSCVSEALTVILLVQQLPPAPMIAGDTLLCAGDDLVLDVVPAYPVVWNTPSGPATGDSILVTNASTALSGVYSASYVQEGCFGPSDTVNVIIGAPPTVDLGPDVLLCSGESHQFSVPNGIAWSWSTGDVSASVTVYSPGLYRVEVMDALGCTSLDSVTVTVEDCDIVIPNIITPNGDGVNDVLVLASPSVEPLHFDVYNRWGQLLFTREARVVQWDGREGVTAQEVPDGTYFFIVHAVFPNGDPLDRTGFIEVRR